MPLKSQALSRGPRGRASFHFFTKLLRWFCAILILQFLIRFVEFVSYGSSTLKASETRVEEILHAFFLGFRFDLSAACYFVVLPLLLAGPALGLLSRRALPLIARLTAVYLALLTTLLLLIAVLDVVFYSYFQDHLNLMIFGFFEDDTTALLQTFWKNYPVTWVVGGWLFAVAAAARWLWREWDPEKFPHEEWGPPRIAFLPLFLVVIVIVGIGARGSFALFPLGVADTTISSDPFINYLSFSPVHSLHRAVKLRTRERSAWNINARNYGYSDPKRAIEDYLGRSVEPSDDPFLWLHSTTPENKWAARTRPHVVVLMMESFGSFWLRYDSPDFTLLGALGHHLREDYLFQNFVPSMTATIGSLSALMINTPHRPDGGFLTESRYLQTSFRTSPARQYRAQGYRTRFIYGGAIGWRDIDKFARTQGFESIEGDHEITAKLGRQLETHDWGLFDEDVWEYLERTLEEATTPELVVVMTTTNHPPYQLPSNYQPLPLKPPAELTSRLNVTTDLALARFRAFQYSNQKLGEFLSRLKKGPLGEKTLLAATGDHGFLLVNFDETEQLQKWQVPLYLYVPKAARPAHVDLNAFGSHADIFPTLMPLSFSKTEIAGLGSNLLDATAPHAAFHFSRLALNSEGAVQVDSARDVRSMTWRTPPIEGRGVLAPGPKTPALENLAKRYEALMAFLDFYYESERKRAPAREEAR